MPGSTENRCIVPVTLAVETELKSPSVVLSWIS